MRSRKMKTINYVDIDSKVKCPRCGWKGKKFDCELEDREVGIMSTWNGEEMKENIPLVVPSRVCPKCEEIVDFDEKIKTGYFYF